MDNIKEEKAEKAEKKLWRLCRDGCPDAREKLIIAYRPLVFWLAGKLKVFPSLRQDIIQEGMLALIRAVDNFDPDRNLRFTTYAYYRIRGQMLNLLERSERRAPMPVDDDLLFAGAAEFSGAPESFGGFGGSDESDEAWFDVAESIGRLKGKEAEVVGALFFQGKNPLEVAEEHKMDVSHVYRLRRSAIAKIREWLGLPQAKTEAPYAP